MSVKGLVPWELKGNASKFRTATSLLWQWDSVALGDNSG